GRVLTDPVAVMPRPVPAGGSWGGSPRPFVCLDGKIVHSYDDCGPGNDPRDPPPEPECPEGAGDPVAPPDKCEPNQPEPPSDRAILNIRSVYDTDFLDSMGNSVLVDGESIPRRADGQPDLEQLRALPDAERPARYLRVSRAVPLPPGSALDAVSGTAFNMQRILGYAPIEPDGSVRVAVPADTPLALAVVDAQGRAFQTHTSWLQARPGEERRCHGCHSAHRSVQPLNAGSPAGGPFEGSRAALSALPGETMAETRTRLDPTALQLQPDPFFTDVWTDPVSAGRAPDPDLTLPYPATLRPDEGIIDYARHIQPIWNANCLGCHGPGSRLDLSDALAPSGRLRSYDSLVLGRPQGATAVQRDGRTVIERSPPLVNVGGSADSSRSSHLVEVLFGQELLAPQSLDGVPDHGGYLTPGERRLIVEWIDLGAAYRNVPARETSAALLARDRFAVEVHPLLRNRCLGCHLPQANSSDIGAPNHRNPPHAPNRFALTGTVEADFGAAAAMVGDPCDPAANALL